MEQTEKLTVELTVEKQMAAEIQVLEEVGRKFSRRNKLAVEMWWAHQVVA